MEEFEVAESYNKLCEDIIDHTPDLEFIRSEELHVCVLLSNKAKKSQGRTVFAECIRMNDLQFFLSRYHFIIVVYEPNTMFMDDEQIRILLTHELMHIGIKNGKTCIIPHDVEEFRAIIDEFGIDWSVI